MNPWLRVPPRKGRDDSSAYQLFWCDGCRLGRLNPVPTWQELSKHYSNYYTHADRPSKSGPSLLEKLRVHIAWRTDRSESLTPDLIRKYLPPNGRVCDLGCGDGMLMRGLVAPGLTIFGVEPDAAARNAAHPGMTILEGSAESLPPTLERGSFDVVVMSHVLEHCADPAAAVRNVRSLLKPGGHAIISVPNNECEGLRRSGPAWRWLDVPRHLNFFTGPSLMKLCMGAGLDPRVVAYEGYCRQFSDEWAQEEARISREFSLRSNPSRWTLLGKTTFARPERKYDSVRIIARSATT